MPKKRFTSEDIIHKLREAEVMSAQGKTVAEISRQLGVTEQTYFRWRKEYGGLKIDQAKRLKELEQENARLRRALSDAVRLFSDHLLQDHLIQCQVGDDTSQARILFFELLELAQLAYAKISVLLLPCVEGCFRHPKLPTDVDHRRATLSQSQCIGDLLFGKSRTFHGYSLPLSGR